VYVERTEAGVIGYGEPIACIVAGVPLVKIYEKDGLHSVNASYPVIKVGEQDDMRLIGRVLGLVGEDDLATAEETATLEELFSE